MEPAVARREDGDRHALRQRDRPRLRREPGRVQQLQPLLELPSTDALRLFGEGLLALAADDLAAAARSLAAGLQAGIANPALMADMQRLLEATEAQRRASASAGVPGVGTETAAVSHGMAISAYTGGGNGS